MTHSKYHVGIYVFSSYSSLKICSNFILATAWSDPEFDSIVLNFSSTNYEKKNFDFSYLTWYITADLRWTKYKGNALSLCCLILFWMYYKVCPIYNVSQNCMKSYHKLIVNKSM